MVNNLNKSIFIFLFLAILLVQAVQAAETYQFVTKWGSEGSGNGQFDNPRGIAVDSSGNVYVVDSYNDRIQKFSSDGAFLAKWGTQGFGAWGFSVPKSIAVDSSGNVYVTNPGANWITKFSSTGTILAKWGSLGSGDGQFSTPSGVAVDSSGNVYVVDTYNNRTEKFSSDGTFLAKWGTPGSGDGQFHYPNHVAVDSSGNVYVSDAGNNGIQKFSSTGTFLAKWGSERSGDGAFQYPWAVTVDSSDNVYVDDGINNRIEKFSSTGTILAKWGSEGSGDGQFNDPTGVAVDSSGNVYVSDTGNNRIQKFAPVQSTLAVSGITPSTATNASAVSITELSGAGFVYGSTVNLTKTGSPDITAISVAVVSSTKISSTFDLNGKIAGSWNVVVTNPDGTTSTLPNGFTITGVVPLTLSVTAISPSTGTNNQSISATVTGTGFKPGAVVRLTLAGQPDIVASGMTLTGDSLITCTFDLTGKTTGTWDLAVTNPGDGTTSVRSTAFTLTLFPPINGTIMVSSNPTGADISIDGVQRGTTPHTFTDIAPGTHSVAVSKIGYLVKYSTITVSQGQPSTVDVTLEPLDRETGTISVISDPSGASIMLDGKYSGQVTPYNLVGVSPGVHTIEITLVGYNSHTETVTVVPGTTVVVRKVWSPPPPSENVFVNSNPDGAKVYIDDSFKGFTPTSFNLKKGTYIVKITKENYVDDESPLYIGSFEPVHVTRTLNPTESIPGFEGILAVISLVAIVLFARKFR